MGLATALPSLWWRKPVMVAWSTPGAAVLASAGLAGGYTMGDAVGAFMMSAALIILVGATGWFERVMNRIPVALASALLAGVLARFGLSGFAAAQSALPLVVLMLLTYLLGKRFAPRYAVPATLLFAVLFVAGQNGFARVDIPLGLTVPVFVEPVFSFSAFVSLALPLFVVTMASQNLPGVAAIRASGFGDERAQGGDAVSCGVLYIALGLFGATIMAVLTAFPTELVAAIAGLALMGTIGNALAAALHKESDREAAMVTFLISLSGVVIGGVGSAFWGVVAGVIALAVQHYRPAKRQA
jgi:benzoate membrane transport protein